MSSPAREGAMRLYLMQHGRPVPKDRDPRQPLSDEGARDVKAVAARLARLGVRPNVIFHSPKDRAKQTAQIVSEQLPGPVRLEERDDVTPLADPAAAMEAIGSGFEEVMIAGHLPHLGKLATRLLTGGTREEPSMVAFRQGSVLCLILEEGNWKVAWMVIPDLF